VRGRALDARDGPVMICTLPHPDCGVPSRWCFAACDVIDEKAAGSSSDTLQGLSERPALLQGHAPVLCPDDSG
jgi:hypothetical protein